MIKRKKLILISVLALIATLCLVAGCKLNPTLDELVDRYEMTARITYFLNDGQFEDKTRIKEMYYKAGSKPFDISVERPSSGSAQLEDKHGAVFTGWYRVKTSANGNPLYTDGTEYVESEMFDVKKSIQMTETPYDFTKPLEKNDHFYVCGDWEEVSKLIIKLSLEDCDELTDLTDTTYVAGDTINESYITGSVTFPGKNLIGTNDYSCISYYYDFECKNPVVWPIAEPEDDNDVIIYAKYIKGNWTIVENTLGVRSMFMNGGSNFYLLNDIDCSDLQAVKGRSYSAGKIRGNNHTISNLKIDGGTLSRNGKGSIFGDIEATAEITDLTLENVSATYSIRTDVDANIYFVCMSLAEGAKISNLNISGNLTINLNSGSVLNNDSSTTWLFGGFDSDSECNLINVISGTTCTINRYDGPADVYEH